MFFVYGDDSSDGKRERVWAIGVVFATGDMWDLLEPKWVARNVGIPFHASDCESGQGNYARLSRAENKSLYRDLVTMLAGSGVGGLGVAIDLEAQRQIVPSFDGFPYYLAFERVLSRTSRLATRYLRLAKFTFDISNEHKYSAGLLYKYFQQNEPEMFRHFDPEISFVPAKESARVQVADLVAFEAMKALDHTIGPVKRIRKSWEALLQTHRFVTESYGTQWFADFKRDYESIGRRLDLKQEDYEEWLQRTRRSDSPSNRFHFISHLASKRGDPW